MIFHYQETTESEGPVFLPPVTFASYRKIVDTHIVDADSLYLILDAVSLLIHPKQFSSELGQNNSKGATPNNSHILTVYFWRDAVKGLSEIYRVLKAGGSFYNVRIPDKSLLPWNGNRSICDNPGISWRTDTRKRYTK